MLIGVLLAINIIVCIALIGVVLMQRSEGGALGMGGGGGGFMTARGAGDLLTRTTWILFSIFLIISLALTILTGRQGSNNAVIDRLKLDTLDSKTLNAAPLPVGPAAPAPTTTVPAPATSAPAAIEAPAPQISAPAPTVSAPKATAPAAKAPAPKAATQAPAAAPVPVISAPAPAEQKPVQ
ncbi:MAG: preprotein translocase subunit SecG [Caulobacter sp.]|nr:preprotein translocase subunit SecG [Caulobacter sp.]